MEQPPSFIDVVLSVLIGGGLGWFVGGLWNLLQGKRFSGKDKR